MKILVTAGGQGTKIWPYSRQNKPKQFQPIVGDTSSYTDTITTLLKQYPPDDILVSTKRKFIRYISEQSPQIPLKNYIVEPDLALDRGPAEGLAFLRLSVDYPDQPFFLVQADCLRTPEKQFLQVIEDAEKIVKKHKRFVTGGIKATEAMLGVDYLQLGERVTDVGEKVQETYHIDAFLPRKSTYHETKELVENFHVVTHCNHTCWYPDLMLDAYKQYRPDWHKALMKIRDGLNKPGEDEVIEKVYATMEKGATEEVTKRVMDKDGGMAILLPFRWTDVGTWTSVYEFFAEWPQNYKDGNVVAIDTEGSLIKTSNKGKLIAVAGVKDLVVVDTDDVLLVIPQEKIDKIKDIQALLQQQSETEYL